jgi:hypothetical protein
MGDGRYEQEEYLEQDDDERESAGRRKALIALAVLAILVIAGLVVVNRLRSVSALQDCLMTRATNCAEIDTPKSP